ncbi:MAG TPA: MBL fold metallo-hydrolase [Frankiaceae bacterium]|nr:MBL fold metallo-hydrolase [Frankiaceae bacterium]
MTATVSCIDVGQGDSTVAVDHASRAALVIDCPAGRHDAALAELSHLGAERVDVVISSHSQADHFGGVLDVIESLAERFTGVLYLNHDRLIPMPSPGESTRDAARRLRALLNRARELKPRVRRAEVPPPIAGSLGALQWELVAPTYDEAADAVARSNPNLASGVVVLTLGAQRVIIGGDAQLPTWERLAGTLPTGAVVRWPHHGGRLSDSPGAHSRVLAVLKPSMVLVSVGAKNRFGHPSAAFFDTVTAETVPLVCTNVTVTCCAGRSRPGVCAGTIRVELDGSSPMPVVRPNRADHDSFIRNLGAAQCLRKPGTAI